VQSKEPVEATSELAAKADISLHRGHHKIPRGPSTAHRATCARRGAPLRMTRD
jgi:hypothetical protein